MTIIDVRSPEEYRTGHVKNSINIPLQKIEEKLNEIKTYDQPIILCCASGGRSGQATMFLKKEGLDCSNGGAWENVQHKINN